MHLYSLTLQRATAITHCIVGSFAGKKTQEIVLGRGKLLELLRADDNGKLQSVYSVEIFGTIRSLQPFRLTGGTKDYVVVGSDSGCIVILEYNEAKNCFDKLHQETYGKSGCRRIVPGEYLACDPKGRAVLIGAVEKQKLLYILNRDSGANLTISSPLEAHKSHMICHDMCGVDVGFDNPVFAALEVDYAEADQDHTGEAGQEADKELVFYEFDMGLNHVVRKWMDGVDPTSNLLISVPGASDGPGGVIVCSENWICWRAPNKPERRVPIPRRQDMPEDRGVLVVASATHKQKDMFFFLVQSEYGDLYKITLNYENDDVSEVIIKYFDTIPTVSSMIVLKTGFLFACSEFGNHGLYEFHGLGDDDDEPEWSSTMMDKADEEEVEEVVFFKPRPAKNLVQVEDIDSLAPIIDAQAADLTKEGSAQLYALCGRGPRSSLRVLRHGLAVQEMAVSELPGNPNAVWTVKKTAAEDYDSYIVVSFVNATLVLSIGETVEEVTDSGFLATSPTLSVSLLGDDALVQVHPGGVRHIRADKRINEWKTPGKRAIKQCAVNQRQVVVALSGGELMYFELDMTGQLVEVNRKEMGSDVVCLDIAPVPEGRQRARFLAVSGWDSTVRLLSLDPEDCMQVLCTQALPAQAESLSVMQMTTQGAAGGADAMTTYLNVGLQNGVLLRTHVDPITGQLSDARTRFLGSRPVKLFKCTIRGTPGMIAMSSRTWLCYSYQSRFHLTPLSYEQLEYCSDFTSEQCPEGIVAITGNTLRILTVERLGETFNSHTIQLRYTPRKFVTVPGTQQMVVIETEHNAFNQTEKEQLRAALAEQDASMEVDADTEEMPESIFGAPKAGNGKWASCIRVLNPTEDTTLDLLELEDNEAAFSLCTAVFHDKGDTQYVIVGTVKDLTLAPRTHSGGFLHVYTLEDGGKRLQLVHKTPVDDVPLAIIPFNGRLLAGIGKTLRIYDLGKKKLLRKCENKNFPTFITKLHTQGDRVYVNDMAESFHFVKYKKSDNQLYIFADDTTPRWLTTSTMVDYNTIAGSDRFGNVYVARLPQELSDEIEDDPTGGRIRWQEGYLNGAPNKIDNIVQFHVGELVTALQKVSLVPGGQDILLYLTMMGGVGGFLPFVSREDVDFFTHLEMHLRQEHPPLCGRDHLSYRSSFVPVKDVVDGDLCEQFAALDPAKQRSIAEDLDRTPGEVMKKLEDMRNRIM